MKAAPRLLCVLMLAVCQTPVLAEQSSPGLSSQVISQVNSVRRQAGCPDLQINPRLTEAARRQSSDMAQRHILSHENGEHKQLAQRLADVRYPYGMAAENVAAGLMDAAEVVKGWLASPAHRANMLDCSLRETGVAIAESDDDYRLYWAQVFGTQL